MSGAGFCFYILEVLLFFLTLVRRLLAIVHSGYGLENQLDISELLL